MKEKPVGYIIIKQKQLGWYVNYHIHLLVKDKEISIGEFDPDQWQYELPDGIDIIEIVKPSEEVIKLLPSLERLKVAIDKVCIGENWTSYIIRCHSKLKMNDIQYRIEEWFKKQRYLVVVDVEHLSRVSSTNIPVNQSMIDNMITKLKKKGE